jgi:hypothetical protein
MEIAPELALPATAVATIEPHELAAVLLFCVVNVSPVAVGLPSAVTSPSCPPMTTITSFVCHDMLALERGLPVVVHDVSV